MAQLAFVGYWIKGIDGTICPKEYNLCEGEENNSYTVYIELEPLTTNQSHLPDLPPDIASDLRAFWGETLKQQVRTAIENNMNTLYSDIEYRANGDGGLLAVHGTTLKKIRADQAEADTNKWGSVLEQLIFYTNRAVQKELHRKSNFWMTAADTVFREVCQSEVNGSESRPVKTGPASDGAK